MTARSPDDIVFQAWIEDLTEQFFTKFDSRVASLEGKVDSGFKRVDQSVSRSAGVIGAIGGVIGGLTIKLVDFALQGVAAFANFAKESIQMRARADVLAQSLEIVGNNAGYSDEQLKQFEEDLKSAGITTIEARQNLAQMAQANLDLNESANLARVAQNAAAIAGINSSEAFSRVLHGITTLQPEILRGLNLTINMEQEIEKWARANNRTAASISYQEKQTIALNAVMKAGEKITGVYENAMGLVGKQVTSLPRYMEELQLAIGEVFQPAYTAAVFDWGNALKEAKEWIDENHDSIERLGEVTGEAVTFMIDTLREAVNFLTSLPGMIEDLGIGIAKIIANLSGVASPEEIEARRSKLGEYFAQAISLLWGYVSSAVAGIKTVFAASFGVLKAGVLVLQGDIQGAMNEMDSQVINMQMIGETMKQAFNSGFLAAAEFTGAIKAAKEETKDAGYEFDKAADDALRLADALQDANSRIVDFARKLEDEMMETAIKESRRAIEDEIRLSWRLEDMARNHAKRVQQILEGGQKARADAIKRNAEERINIERDYQRRLRDLQRDFEFEADELARRRDAVGLLRLMRQNQKNLEDERQGRSDRVEDAKRSEKENLKAVEERLQEQMKMVNQQYAEEQVALERELSREREIRELHSQWEQEDRDKKHAQQLAELIQQMQSIQGITDTGLQGLLSQWGGYFGVLLPMAFERMMALQRIIFPGLGGFSSQKIVTPGGAFGTPVTRGQRIVGQGGQVSQMLADRDAVNTFRSFSVPSVPSVPATTSSMQRKEIVIKADLAGIDPHIQRQIVRTMYEIERNQSG